MNEPLSSLEPLPEREGGASLAHFAFAASTASAPDLPAVLPSPLPDVFSGRYRLEQTFGVDGVGTVYRARDLFHKQFGDPVPLVALKLLNESVAESPDASALLCSRFALTRRLRHSNAVRLFIFDVNIACWRVYIVMELMPSLPLGRLPCERPGDLPWSELNAIAWPLLDTLAYVHERGVLHGDLRPSNVTFDEEGVRFSDLGLGQAQTGILDGLSQLSRGRIGAWTPGYTAPEPLEDAPLSLAADPYALTCVLYELADGRHPLRRLPSNQAQGQGLEHQLRAPGHLPRRCWPALRTTLSLDPERRCIGVHELQGALGARRSWLAGILAR